MKTFNAGLLLQAQELVNVGTWSWDVATDTVLWSDELFRLFGREPQSVPLNLETYLSLVDMEDRDRVGSIIQGALRTGMPFEFDVRIHTPLGVQAHLHCRGTVLRDAGGEVACMVGACLDVTDRVLQTDALRRSEEWLRSIFEQSAVGMALTDESGLFVEVNPAFASFLGYQPEELRGVSFLDLTHTEDLALTHDMLAKAEQSSTTYEKRYVQRGGATVWGRATVTRLRPGADGVSGYSGIIEDWTERRHAADALKSQTELMRQIMDNLPVMVSVFDAQGMLTYVNKEWQRVFGWTLEEASGFDVIADAYPDPDELAAVRKSIRSGRGTWERVESRTRTGKTVPTSWACLLLSDDTCVTIGQDDTERNGLQMQLVQVQKMEALGQLAGGVAHDFNNVLTIISSCTQFLLEVLPADSASAGDANEILAACERAAALTRQLLAFSRKQMLKPEVFDVNQSVRNIAKGLGRLVGEHIELAIATSQTPAFIEADPHQLEQVLLNLVVNARDAIDDKGVITIGTEMRNRVGSVIGEFVVISVSDNGAGMDDATQARIFEPFFTTKPIGKGTGLGLATVLGIVDQSGGRIEVDSEVGRGTTFRIIFPAALTGADMPRQPRVPDCFRGNETVMIVEDESSLRSVLARVLSHHGYHVLQARHGIDALELSSKHEGPIHLLITDVVMPEMGGRQLVRKFRQQRPGIPVLYVSGYTDDELLRSGILESGAELLRKPFRPDDLVAAAHDLLKRTAITVASFARERASGGYALPVR